MKLKRFTARTSREALALVKAAYGEDAVVMSTKPCEGGVEVLAMAPESLDQLERVAAATPAPDVVRAPAAPRENAPAAPRPPERKASRVEPSLEARVPADVEQDLEQLQMSTLSF